MQYTITEQDAISFQFFQFFERQKAYMLITGQIDESNKKTEFCQNYQELYDEEEIKFFNAIDQNNTLKQLEALANCIVFLCGLVATKKKPTKDDYKMFENLFTKGCKLSSRFIDIVDEVFDNNKRCLIFDENGNIQRQPKFLEDGTRNPKAFKVLKKDLKPNLEQFFKL